MLNGTSLISCCPNAPLRARRKKDKAKSNVPLLILPTSFTSLPVLNKNKKRE